MDYQALLYNPIYAILGVPAVLKMGEPYGDVELTALDKTAGITLDGPVDLQTVHPAAVVRAVDLDAVGIGLELIDGKRLTLNGKEWRITSLHASPSPKGEADGEVFLILDGGVG